VSRSLREWGNEHVSPMLALAGAVVAMSTASILIRWSAAPSSVVAFYRVLFTLALVVPFVLGERRSEFRTLSRRDLLSATAAGIALGIHFAAWFESLAWTSVAASVTLVQTQPVFVAIGAYLLLDERIDRRIVGGIVLTVCGAAAMTLADPGAAIAVEGDARFGNTLALVGAVAAGAYVLAGRSIRQRVSVFPYVTVVYASCALTLLAVVGAQDAALLGYPPREWVLFVALAAGPGLLGHTVINWALEHVRSTVVGITMLGEPVGATILAVLLLAEVPGTGTVLGGVIVLGGIYLASTSRSSGGDREEGSGGDREEGSNRDSDVAAKID